MVLIAQDVLAQPAASTRLSINAASLLKLIMMLSKAERAQS